MAKKYAYYVDGDNISIVENTSETLDYNTSDWSTVSSVLTFRVYGSYVPAKLSLDSVTTEVPLPHNLDECVLNSVIAQGYEDPRNMVPQASQMFNQKAQFFLREAKKRFRSRRQKGGYIKPVDY